MPATQLKEFLDSHGVRYETIQHLPAYTAQEIAASAHIPGSELAKTVMVKLDGKMAMAVVPASHQVNFEELKKATGTADAKLADEQEFRDRFPECEPGAMPPFGNLYGIEVYASKALADDEEIAFNAGSHSELIRLRFADFQRLVQPKMAEFSANPQKQPE